MAEIVELLNHLPPAARFSAGADERASFDQALTNGWSVRQLAEGIEAACTGPGVRSQSAVAVSVLHRLAGQAPPPVRNPVDNTRGVGFPMPECASCGQPFGGKGGFRPRTVGGACPSCGVSPVTLRQWDHHRQCFVQAFS